ncbi:SipW-dependent-type signal peptide-containing protein [Natronomonas marina]|jgi:predicted ribosomally synthesized peptide with SipW-like signal peptide|uniref:SipW-dependent-type signal peptide-containing protein n=1 Tax=Natronomonas marina TaxID=2961939 RepID=UPI0020C96EBF|nr:SipW-dependent-type signal peptide-containing protein [Natronomonas marina]
MPDYSISRRQLLAGLAVTGGTGAVAGSGSAALFSDTETFEDNDVSASKSVAGVVDIEVTVGSPNPGMAELRVSLPDDVNNNPSHVWVRTKTCPDPVVAATTYVEVYRVCGNDWTLIDQGTAFDVFTSETFREGFLLSCGTDENDCLRPGETRTLVIQTPSAPSSDLDLELEFYAEQCRYGSAPGASPFAESETLGPDECGSPPSGKDISWIGFCATADTGLTDDDLAFTVDGDTLVLTDAPESLGAVVLKYGTEIRVFGDPGAAGVFTTAEGGTVYQQQGSGFGNTDRSNPDPCPGVCGLKYEVDDDVGSPEAKGCSS